MTNGDFDIAYCRPDESVRFPAFRVTCPINDEDKMTWFEFVLDIADQNWNDSGYAGLVWQGEADSVYRAAPWRRAWVEEIARQTVDEAQASDEEHSPEDLETKIHAEAGVQPLGDTDNYQEASNLLSNAIVTHQATPGQAAARVMEAMAGNMQTNVRSWTLITDDLERMHLPDEIVTTPGLRAAVIAAPWQGPDEPWSMYRVVIIYPDSDMDAPTQLAWPTGGVDEASAQSH